MRHPRTSARKVQNETAKAGLAPIIGSAYQQSRVASVVSSRSSSRSGRRQPLLSQSPSPAPDRDDRALAEVCHNSLRVSGDVTSVDAAGAEAILRGNQKTPEMPPGEHWTKYTD